MQLKEMENPSKLITGVVVITEQSPVSFQIYIPIILNSLTPCNGNLTFCVDSQRKKTMALCFDFSYFSECF